MFKKLGNEIAHRAPQVQPAFLPIDNRFQLFGAMSRGGLPEDTPVLGEVEDVPAHGTVILNSAKTGGWKHSRLMGR